MVDLPFKQSVIRMFVGFWGITDQALRFLSKKKPKQRQASKTLIFVQTKAKQKWIHEVNEMQVSSGWFTGRICIS